MAEADEQKRGLRREHPVFFWGVMGVLVLLIGGSVAVGVRALRYQEQADALHARMSETERETRDRVLDSRARRAELALALLRRELRLRDLQDEGVHLAISTEDSVLALRHGPTTLREIPVAVGSDSTIRAPDGRSWRLIRALGERHLVDKDRAPVLQVPEWVYVAAGEPVPPAAERRVEGGLGEYVLRLDDGTEIYSRPERGPFAQAVKPAAFAADAEQLRAIFDAVTVQTPVYIY